MARMSVDDSFCRDPRVLLLAKKAGWSRRETMGALLDVWAVCYDQASYLITEHLIDLSAGLDGFAQLMIESELAGRDRSGRVRISGVKSRIDYLNHQREAGRQGGLKSGESRSTRPKLASSSRGSLPQAAVNPSAPDLPSASVPDPVPDSDQTPIAPKGGVSVSRIGKRKTRPADPTGAELQTVSTVLGKLGSHTGIAYSGASEHVRLIVGQIRDGLSERDLRAIVGYCALPGGLNWAEKPDLAKYLRPETLFGPRTVARYLDAARAWAAKLPADSWTSEPTEMTANG